MKTSEKPIIVEHQLSSSIECVWEAITQIDKMKWWFFENISEFNPKVDFALTICFIILLEPTFFSIFIILNSIYENCTTMV